MRLKRKTKNGKLLCSKCHLYKEKDLFPMNRKYINSWCKACKYLQIKNWRHKNRDKVAEYNKRQAKKLYENSK